MIEEVRAFARDYINNPKGRTSERKAKIRQAYKELFKSPLAGTCRTCYIEAVFKILKYKTMSKYELKRGYVAQFEIAYKGIKAFTNNNLMTDPNKYEPVAEEYLRQYPQRAVYFIRAPQPEPYVPPIIKVVEPKVEPKEELKEELPVMPDPTEVINTLTIPKKKIRKKIVKK